MHVYAHDRCQANLSMGWLVCFWQFFMKWSAYFGSTLQAKYILVDVSWAPGTMWCTQRQYIISIRTSTTAAKVVIFFVNLSSAVRFLFPLLRACRCPRQETGSSKKRQSNKEWQAKTARACIGIHTFLIDGSWLLPTKRLFRSAANFDFHDNRPKMADLKSVYMCMDLISGKYWSCIIEHTCLFLRRGEGFKRNDAFSFFRKYR